MLKFLIPKFPLQDLPIMLGFCLIGSLIAGVYGIIHDHVTYSIGPEYFTNFKFNQFEWANLGLGDRVFVSCIGFLATWWVGLISAWILARRMLPSQPRRIAYKKIMLGFGVIFVTGTLFGIGGFLYGNYRGPDADYSDWKWAFLKYNVSDQWSFIRVAYIHNAGYLGGLTGLLLTYFVIRPRKKTIHGQENLDNRATLARG